MAEVEFLPAPYDAGYKIAVADGRLPNAQVLASLATGLVKNTTATGVFSIAVADTDFMAAGHTITAGAGLSGGTQALSSNPTISLPNVGPGAGTIGGGSGQFIGSVTLDAQGRVTGATVVTGGAVAAYTTVDAAGTPLTQRNVLNFSTAFTAVDNAGATRTDVDLAAVGPGAGFYGGTGIASLTLDAKGRVVSLTSTSYLTQAYTTIKDSTGAAQTPRFNLKFTSEFALSDVAPDTVVDLANVGPGTGTYGGTGIASITLSSKGRVTALVAGGYVPLTTQVIAGVGLTGGGALSSNVTISMPNVGPGAGLIGGSGISSITLDAQGRVTAATAASYQPLLSLTAGSVIFSGGGSILSQDNANFFYDGTNHRLSIGMNGTSPANPLTVGVGGTALFAITPVGDWVPALAVLADNATVGFQYIRGVAHTPFGVWSGQGNNAPLVVSQNDRMMWFGDITSNSWRPASDSLKTQVNGFSGVVNTTVDPTDVERTFIGNGAVNLTLPSVSSSLGRRYWIKNGTYAGGSVSSYIQILPAGSDLIDGYFNNTTQLLPLLGMGGWCCLICDGTQWEIFSFKVVSNTSLTSWP